MPIFGFTGYLDYLLLYYFLKFILTKEGVLKQKTNEINYRNFIAFIVLTSCSGTDVNVSETSSQRGNGEK
jgi:hypothetical protein